MLLRNKNSQRVALTEIDSNTRRVKIINIDNSKKRRGGNLEEDNNG